MRIANPMYDVVFKYLLSDNKIAKMLISAIIGEEIVELEFSPTEHRGEIEVKSLLVYHLDFAAKIKKPDGSFKLVLIEIQKAKYPSDIMRFRRYLGNQYADKNNFSKDEEGKSHAFPIVTIYFLGHGLQYTHAPVINVRREYVNVSTGEKIKTKEEFIESLTHDSFIIQVPRLAKKRKTELEQILSVFDQSCRDKDFHVLNIDENDYPEKYSKVIRRLLKAISEPNIRENMNMEDEILGEFESLERMIAENEKTIEDKEKVIEGKEKVIEDKEKEVEKAINNQKQILRKAVEALKSAGLSEEEAKRRLED